MKKLAPSGGAVMAGSKAESLGDPGAGILLSKYLLLLNV